MSDEIKPEVYFYLASPYSHPLQEVRDRREREISNIGAKLSTLGLNLFCPITQSHRLNDFLKPHTQLGHDECMRIDYALLDQSAGLIVAKLQGWEVSVGVALEIEYARKKGLMIYMLETDIFEDSQLISFVAKEVKNIKERYAISQHGIDKYGEPSYDTTKEDKVSEFRIPTDTGATVVLDVHPDLANAEKDHETFVSAEKSFIRPIKSNKGASKEGKPSIMNFPWGAYKHEELPGYMDDIIENIDNHDKLRSLLYKLFCVLMQTGITHLDINEVFSAGAAKHGLRTHRNYTAKDIDVLVNALGRHILKDRLVEIDDESGFTHRAHIGANILMLQQILNQEEKQNGE